MCGIAGVFDRAAQTPAAQLELRCLDMVDALEHRGPDDRGVWTDASTGVGLASRRLAIVDLSPLGHQPMVSANARYAIAYNGEIYNHTALRSELEPSGYAFRGRSDTEVLLAAISAWGLDGALERCNGMFAFALWDAQARVLHLARDRLGEKPLYYALIGHQLVFASELKSLRRFPAFAPTVDRGAVASYLGLSYIPAPRTIYEDVYKLPPGTVLDVAAGSASLPAPRSYWSLDAAVTAARGAAYRGSVDDASDELDALLRDSVGMRMHADTPLGAFLSGGIDSSTVVALMQAQSERPVRTFTISMPAAGLDESREALAVARCLGTDHTSVEITPDDAFSLIPQLPHVYDEPFADPSELPTLLLSQVARRDVTVALSGDGGDEMFAGYNRYVLGRRLWRFVDRIPRPLRSGAAHAALRVPPPWWDTAAAHLPNRLAVRAAADKVQKLGTMLLSPGPEARYAALVTHWPVDALVDHGGSRGDVNGFEHVAPPLLNPTEAMNFMDTAVSLPDDMLVKVDRASMHSSLEVRVPFLDHRVLEFAWRIPFAFRVNGREGKWIVRRVLDRYVPRSLFERPKVGFDPPLGEWLRGPLRTWAEELLSPERLRQHGYIDPAAVQRTWMEHQSRRRNWEYRLWCVLMLESWLDTA